MKKKAIIIFTFFISIWHCLPLQVLGSTDSLITIDNSLDDKKRIQAYINLSKENRKSTPSISKFYANKALLLSSKSNDIEGMVNSLDILSEFSILNKEYDKSAEYLEEAVKTAKKGSNSKLLGDICLKLADVYIKSMEYELADQAVTNAKKAYIKLSSETCDGKADIIYGKLNIVLKNIDLGFFYMKKGIALIEKYGNDTAIVQSYIYMAENYKELNMLDSSLYYLKGAEQFNLEYTSAKIAILMGDAYSYKNNTVKAFKQYQKAIHISIQLKDHAMHADALSKVADNYERQGNYIKAINSHKKAIYHYNLIGGDIPLALSYKKIGHLYIKIGNYNLAKKYFEKSLESSLGKELFYIMRDTYLGMSDVFIGMNDSKQAYRYYLLFLQMNDSTIKQNFNSEVAIINTKHTKNKEENALKLLRREKEISELRMKNFNSFILTLIIGFLVIIILSIVFYVSSRSKLRTNKLLNAQNKKITKQKEEILVQRNNLEKLYHSLSCQKERIEIQRDLISKKNKNITAGIKYAEMIQKAILPTELDIKMIFPDSFILYLPKDIVSGDFYHLEKKGNLIYFAAVDCTGHGIPGAFMSLVGFNELSEVLGEDKYTRPSDILNDLNKRVNKTLNQNHKDNANKEGMDLALCCYHKDNFELEYAGAFNPLYIVRNGTLTEYKGDPFPIGISSKKQELEFTNHRISLLPGDSIYIFTDGYVDQFGGHRRKKFLRKRFKQALVDGSYNTMGEQKEILIDTFNTWKGNYEQIDDVLVMGIKIPDII